MDMTNTRVAFLYRQHDFINDKMLYSLVIRDLKGIEHRIHFDNREENQEGLGRRLLEIAEHSFEEGKA